MKFEYAGDLRAELLNKAELGSPLQGADLSSVLHHLEHVCERTNEKPFAMLIRCASATKNGQAIAAPVSRSKAQNGLEELLAVLNDKASR